MFRAKYSALAGTIYWFSATPDQSGFSIGTADGALKHLRKRFQCLTARIHHCPKQSLSTDGSEAGYGKDKRLIRGDLRVMTAGMLQGKVAIVTGSGRGIGRAIAIMMAAKGASVVVNDVGASVDGASIEGTPADEVVRTITEAGGKAVPNADSVAEWDSAHRIVQTALDAFGRVDIVVNNAGILRDAMFHKMTPENFDAVVKVHLYGTFLLTRAAITHFMRQKSGCFIHMTSTSGYMGAVGQANYASAKTAMFGLNQAIAQEYKSYNIRSNLISPGAATRMTTSVSTRSAEELARREATMRPESVAALATVLASDEASDVNGQLLGARGEDVMLFNQTRPIRFLNKRGGWTPEAIIEALPRLQPLFTPVHGLKVSMPWID